MAELLAQLSYCDAVNESIDYFSDNNINHADGDDDFHDVDHNGVDLYIVSPHFFVSTSTFFFLLNCIALYFVCGLPSGAIQSTRWFVLFSLYFMLHRATN